MFYNNLLYIYDNKLFNKVNKAMRSKKQLKGINAFLIIYYIALIIVVEQLIKYSQWTVQLIKKWKNSGALEKLLELENK